MNSFTPWVEKYRPNTFDDIVLDQINKKILENIIKNEHFPNLLFYEKIHLMNSIILKDILSFYYY